MSQTRRGTQPTPRPLSFRWNDRWAEFLSLHGDWWRNQIKDADAIYAIPDPIIDELCNTGPSGPRRTRGQRFFSNPDEQSERAFTYLCKSWNHCVVGVTSEGEILHYELLSPAAADWIPASDKRTDSDMFSEGRIRYLLINQSQMVHAAIVIQQPDYCRELKALKAKWYEIHRTCHLTFKSINGRMLPFDSLLSGGLASDGASGVEADFRIALTYFAKKWELAALPTWDLPLPKRPLMLPPPESPASLRMFNPPSHVFPEYFPPSRLLGDGTSVWQAGRSLHFTKGILKSATGQRFVRKHYNTLRTYLAELAVRKRFDGVLPNNASDCFHLGLERVLGLSCDHGRRYRKACQSAFA